MRMRRGPDTRRTQELAGHCQHSKQNLNSNNALRCICGVLNSFIHNIIVADQVADHKCKQCHANQLLAGSD